MFTAVVRVSGTGRLDDFRERVRWLMVRDEDAEDYTEHHGKGTLEYRESDAALICHSCRLRYPIRDDIPIMLLDEATPL